MTVTATNVTVKCPALHTKVPIYLAILPMHVHNVRMHACTLSTPLLLQCTQRMNALTASFY